MTDIDRKKGQKRKKKNKYITCKTDEELMRRVQLAANIEKRSISNLINFIVEQWLNENEIR